MRSILASLAVILALCPITRAGYEKLETLVSGLSTSFSAPLEIGSEQKAIYMTSTGGVDGVQVELLCRRGMNTAESVVLEGSEIDGPASIRLKAVGASTAVVATAFAVMKVGSKGELSTSDGVVVVPNDNGAPVAVLIETSTDLENWVLAQEGDYGFSGEKRFFRVRAARIEK